jgi:AraC family transcriptional regulator, transcriptional activator of pobA
MIEISLLEKTTALNQPRRVMKYVLIWCSAGKLSLVVDEKEFELKANDVITITSGQAHYIKKNQKAKGFVLEFAYAFFCKDDKDIELIFHNGLFCHFAMNEVIPIKRAGIVEEQLQSISNELSRQPYQYQISVHSRVELILVEINRAKVERGDEIWKPDALFLKFLEIVRANFEHNYTLSQFAKMLGTTTLKLNEQAKLHTGKTAQMVIYSLITSEARRLLTYENLTVKEVAYKLGFNDPFYFSNFFKKHMQVSPKSYQEKYAL